MNDLGTTVEHMGRAYIWRANKRSQRVHILDSEMGRTFCQTENCGGKPLDGRGVEIPAGRRLCQNCTNLAGRNEADYREPDIRVLLGERMAEVEPMLFASGAVLDLGLSDVRPKRREQARPVNRPKRCKPKRTAKYARPFNDDLPW